ncbi:MAG: TolC family protein [Flavisolibacter sp.]|nr:TolC family protein [Flavisolibacter sp.]
MKVIISLILLLTTSLCHAQIRTLEYFLQQANQNSPTIKNYQNQILIARIDSQILRASLRTQVNFLNANSYAPVIKGWGYDEVITNIANVTTIIQANRNFITPNYLAAQLRTIDLQRRALLDTIQLSQKDLVRTITDQYITAYAGQLAVDFTKEVFELMKNEEVMLKKLTEQSVFKQSDYLNFYVTMQQQELTYLQAQNQFEADYLTLNYLSGIVDTTVHRLKKPDLQEVLQNNIDSSVFLKRFANDSLRLVNEKELIAYQYKPKIGAYADGGYNSSLQVMPYRNFGFSAGLSLTIPIYDGRQRQLKYAQVDIRERTRQSNKQFFLNQYAQQIAQLRKQLHATELLVDKINKQIEYSHTLIIANNKLLETGDIAMRDYVTAINNYLNAQNLLTLNTIERLRAVNQINYWNR